MTLSEMKLSLRGPADLLAAVPYLLGFHPTDSLVIVGVRAGAVVFNARIDLPPADAVGPAAAQLSEIVGRQRISRAVIVGYGPEDAVTPMVSAVRRALRRRRIDVPEALRVTGGRYWSYVCRDPQCCDPAGVPFDVATSEVAATATVAGMAAVASRDVVEERIRPVTGKAALAMSRAAMRADERLEALAGGPDPAGSLLAAGIAAVDAAIAKTALGARLSDDEVAWLALVLTDIRIRDHAWGRVDESPRQHVTLWTDVLRRADPELGAPPATLLAFAAWRDGGGAMPSIAIERALAINPDYRMARYLSLAIDNGLDPRTYDEIATGSTVATAGASRQDGAPADQVVETTGSGRAAPGQAAGTWAA